MPQATRECPLLLKYYLAFRALKEVEEAVSVHLTRSLPQDFLLLCQFLLLKVVLSITIAPARDRKFLLLYNNTIFIDKPDDFGDLLYLESECNVVENTAGHYNHLAFLQLGHDPLLQDGEAGLQDACNIVMEQD